MWLDPRDDRLVLVAVTAHCTKSCGRCRSDSSESVSAFRVVSDSRRISARPRCTRHTRYSGPRPPCPAPPAACGPRNNRHRRIQSPPDCPVLSPRRVHAGRRPPQWLPGSDRLMNCRQSHSRSRTNPTRCAPSKGQSARVEVGAPDSWRFGLRGGRGSGFDRGDGRPRPALRRRVARALGRTRRTPPGRPGVRTRCGAAPAGRGSRAGRRRTPTPA